MCLGPSLATKSRGKQSTHIFRCAQRTKSLHPKMADDKKPVPTYKTPAGLSSLFGQVDEVKTEMSKNIEAIQERGYKLEQLDETTREMLNQAESMSKNSAKKTK